MQRTFEVTLTGVWDADLLTTDLVKNRINDAYQGTDIAVSSISKYNPENLVRHNKIPAIKRVRDVITVNGKPLGLKEAKCMVDSAEKTGSYIFMHVTIKLESIGVNRMSSQFRVIDNS